jgi:hypothetical protein
VPCLCGATGKLGGGEIGHFLCLLERRHDEHPMSPPLSITCLFGSSEGGRGLVICSAVPGRRLGDYPLSPPSSHYTNVWFFGGGGVQVICSAVLGRRHGEHNLFPPHIPRRLCLSGGIGKVQCSAWAMPPRLNSAFPHSQGRVTRMALPLFFLSGCASLSIDKDFFSALYINHYYFSPHEYSCL